MKKLTSKTTYGIPALFLIITTLSPLFRLMRMNQLYIPIKDVLHYLTFIILAIYAVICILQFKGLSLKNIAVNTFFFSVLIILTTAISLNAYSDKTIITNAMKASFWGVSLISFYFIGLRYNEILNKISLISIIIPVFYILVLGSFNYRESIEFSVGTSAYYLACFLPFAFLSKNKVWKWLCFVLTVMAILESGKRTGFILIFILIFVYIFVSNKIKGKKNLNLIRTTVIFIISYFIISYIINKLGLSVIDRMLQIEEDGGSGRVEIYKLTLDMINSSDFMKLFFGHGFNRVLYNSGIGLSAHNDFLEVIYDYGLVGMIFYINMFVILIRYGKKMIDEKSEYAPAFFAALAVLIPLSLTSHLIIYDTYFINLCAFFGLIIGNYDRKEKMKQNE